MYFSRDGLFSAWIHRLFLLEFFIFIKLLPEKNFTGSYAFTAAVSGYGQTGEIGLSILLNGKPGVTALA